MADLDFYACFKTPEAWAATSGVNYANPAQVLAWFKRKYAGWSSRWDQLFAQAAPPVIPRPLYYMPLN